MQIKRAFSLGLSFGFAATFAVASDIVWFPLSRSIDLSLDFDPFEIPETPAVVDSAVGPASGSWIESASATNQYPFAPGRSDGDAGQFSLPTADGLTCDLFSDLVIDAPAPFALELSVSSISTYQGYFAVGASTELTLEGDLSASHFAGWQPVIPSAYEAYASVEIRRVGGDELFSDMAYVQLFINQATGELVSVSTPIAWIAVVPPGVYEIVVQTVAHNFNEADAVQTELPMRLNAAAVLTRSATAPPTSPCDADLDEDGDTDLIDFARFQRCFDGPN